jgi:hypothetical protein
MTAGVSPWWTALVRLTESITPSTRSGWNTESVTTRIRPANPPRWVLPFPGVLVAVLTIVCLAGSASAASSPTAGTRVGARNLAVDVLIEPPDHIAAGQWPGEVVAAPKIVVATGVAAETVPEVAQTGDTVLYQKLSSTGEHLKYGITKNPATRYTSKELNGGSLNILARGSKPDMLALERLLHETLPIGPEEGQLFYIQKQIANGLRPPPYPW